MKLVAIICLSFLALLSASTPILAQPSHATVASADCGVSVKRSDYCAAQIANLQAQADYYKAQTRSSTWLPLIQTFAGLFGGLAGLGAVLGVFVAWRQLSSTIKTARESAEIAWIQLQSTVNTAKASAEMQKRSEQNSEFFATLERFGNESNATLRAGAAYVLEMMALDRDRYDHIPLQAVIAQLVTKLATENDAAVVDAIVNALLAIGKAYPEDVRPNISEKFRRDRLKEVIAGFAVLVASRIHFSDATHLEATDVDLKRAVDITGLDYVELSAISQGAGFVQAVAAAREMSAWEQLTPADIAYRLSRTALRLLAMRYVSERIPGGLLSCSSGWGTSNSGTTESTDSSSSSWQSRAASSSSSRD